jgi:hypothetical protein
VGWVIAIAVALVGAAAAGASNWLLERRRDRVEAAAAILVLKENLETAKTSLATAIDINWWWPAGSELQTQGWDEYRTALLRRYDAQALAAVASAVGQLRSLNAWASIQRDRQARIEQETYESLKRHDATTETTLEELVASAQEYGPDFELGASERQALERGQKLTLEAIRAVADPLDWKRFLRSRKIQFAISPILAIAALAIVLALRPAVFTSETLATALGNDLGNPTLVACSGVSGEGDAWDCTAAWEEPSSSCTRVPQLVAASPGVAAEVVAAAPRCLIARAEAFRVLRERREAKEDCFMAFQTGVEPAPSATTAAGTSGRTAQPSLPGNTESTTSQDGLSPTVAVGPQDTIAGCVN